MMTVTPVDPNRAAPPPIPAEEQPLAEPRRGLWPSRFSMVFGIVVIVLTLAGLALAALAPQLVPQTASTVPAGWTTVFDGIPSDGVGWESRSGCNYIASGLHVVGDEAQDACAYLPSKKTDLLSQGFQLSVALAPDGAVKLAQVPLIALIGGDSEVDVVLDQAGQYVICQDACQRGSGIYVVGLTVAWHTDGYTPNTITLRYLPTDNSLILFTNGQEVRTVQLALPTQPELRLGADSGAEAIFTHVTLSSASGGS